MPNSRVRLVINDFQYLGWKTMSIDRTIEAVSGRFRCSLIDTGSVINPDLAPGASCQVLIDDHKLINGYIDSVEASVTKDRFSYRIAGRDKTADIVDGCADIRPGTWKDQTILNFAKIMATAADIDVISDGSFTDEKTTFTIEVGDTIFSAINRGSRSRGILMLTDEQGRLVLSSPGSAKADDALVLGQNVKELQFTVDYTNRFYKYIVRSQRSSKGKGWTSNEGIIKATGSAYDPDIRNTRYLILPAEDQVTDSLATKRAQWEASVRNAMSEIIRIQLPTFYQSSNALWRENLLVHLSGSLGNFTINSDYIISSINYTMDDSGLNCTLGLRDKDSFKPEPIVPKKETKQRGKVKWL